MQQHLLTSLYENEFQQFVRFKLVERAKVRLGKAILSDREKDGLSDAFVITNPRLRDHPIVMASDGFSKVRQLFNEPSNIYSGHWIPPLNNHWT